MLSLPWAMSKSSLIPGICGIIFGTVYSCISCIFVLHACQRTQIYEYSALLKAIHPFCEGAAGVILIYVTLSTLLSFYILIGDFTTEAIEGINPDWTFDRRIYIVSVFLVLLLPLSLLREFKALQLSSIVGNLTTTYAVILILVFALSQWSSLSTHSDATDPTDPTDSVQSAPPVSASNGFSWSDWNLGVLIVTNVVSKACASTYAIPPMYQQLKHRNVATMRFVIVISYTICTAIYILFAIAGYSIFGVATESDIFNNFSNGNALFVAARLGWNFSLIGSYPIAFKSCLQTIEYKFFKNRWNFRENPRVRVVVILVMALSLLVTSLLVEDVGPVSSIEGAITILCLVCIFPILMAWKIGLVHHQETGTKQRRRFLFGLQLMLLIGIGLGTGGIVMQLHSLEGP